MLKFLWLISAPKDTIKISADMFGCFWQKLTCSNVYTGPLLHSYQGLVSDVLSLYLSYEFDCAALHYIALYSALPHCTVLFCTAVLFTVLFGAAMHCTDYIIPFWHVSSYWIVALWIQWSVWERLKHVSCRWRFVSLHFGPLSRSESTPRDESVQSRLCEIYSLSNFWTLEHTLGHKVHQLAGCLLGLGWVGPYLLGWDNGQCPLDTYGSVYLGQVVWVIFRPD